jgi:hypothetical protein
MDLPLDPEQLHAALVAELADVEASAKAYRRRHVECEEAMEALMVENEMLEEELKAFPMLGEAGVVSHRNKDTRRGMRLILGKETDGDLVRKKKTGDGASRDLARRNIILCHGSLLSNTSQHEKVGLAQSRRTECASLRRTFRSHSNVPETLPLPRTIQASMNQIRRRPSSRRRRTDPERGT